MTVFQVDFEVHCANGEERRESLLFDSESETLIGHFGTKHAYVCDYKPEIERVKRAIQDPTDPQRHPSGFYLRSAVATEVGMLKSEFDGLAVSSAKHQSDDIRVRRLRAEGWEFHANYDPREEGGLESAMHTSASLFVRPSNAREVLIVDRAYGADGIPITGNYAIYMRHFKQPK